MEDFLKFKKMITPIIIQLIFYIGAGACVIFGLIGYSNYDGAPALLLVFGGPLAVRLFCELLIVVFTINDTLTDIKNQLKQQNIAKPSRNEPEWHVDANDVAEFKVFFDTKTTEELRAIYIGADSKTYRPAAIEAMRQLLDARSKPNT